MLLFSSETLSDQEIVQEGVNVVLGCGDKKIISSKSGQGDMHLIIGTFLHETPHPVRQQVKLSLQKYLILRDNMNALSDSLKNMENNDSEVKCNIHLGGNFYASVTSPYKGVSIRRWFRKGSNPKLFPGFGTFLKQKEWEDLLDVDKALDDLIPCLRQVVRCIDTHDGQLSAIGCSECNPNGLHYEWL